MNPRLSVVVPVFNERATIHEILLRIQAVDLEKEILVVDDGSTDGSKEFLTELATQADSNSAAMTLPEARRQLRIDNIRVFFQDRNRGKGAALRRVFEEARGNIVIVQDADLEYDPLDYFGLIDPIERGLADVVYGSRFLGSPHWALPTWQGVSNSFLTTLSNLLTNLDLSDVWTCYKAFKRDVLQSIELRENRFGFEPEITAQIAKTKCRILEVPISYRGRTYTEGKKITWRDGFRGVWCTLRYNLFA